MSSITAFIPHRLHHLSLYASASGSACRSRLISNWTRHFRVLPDLCLLSPDNCLIFSAQDGSLSREKSFACYLPVLTGRSGNPSFKQNVSPIQTIGSQGAMLINALKILTTTSSTFFRRFLVIVAWHLSAMRPLLHPPSGSTTRLHHDPLSTSQRDHFRDHLPSLSPLPQGDR
jgi:hypothetical protein